MVTSLSWPEQLNVEADRLATYALQLSYKEASDHPIPFDCQFYLIMDNLLITSQYRTYMRKAAGRKEGIEYVTRKLDLPTSMHSTFNWASYRRARA